jgi:flagellar motor switch protein FliG
MADSVIAVDDGDEVDLSELTQVQRTAILMMALGKETATKLLKQLNPPEIQAIGSAMTTLPHVSRQQVDAILRTYLAGFGKDALGVDPDSYARGLLMDALGENSSHVLDVSMLSDQLKGLETLKWMHPGAVSNMLKNEHPQVMAIVLSYFEPDQAATVLQGIPERFRSEVIYRIATLNTIQPQALFDLNAIFENQASDSSGGKMATIGGVKRAAEILNLVGGGGDGKILDDIAIEHTDISQAIQDNMFTFDNLAAIDGRGIQSVLAEIPADVLLLALKGADKKMQAHFLDNMSKRQALILKDDLENSGPVKLSEVEGAQRTIITTVRRLANEGKLMMPGGGEDMVG